MPPGGRLFEPDTVQPIEVIGSLFVTIAPIPNYREGANPGSMESFETHLRAQAAGPDGAHAVVPLQRCRGTQPCPRVA